MRSFEHANLSHDWRCMVCGKSEDKPVVLVPIAETFEDNLIAAEQVHLDCIDIIFYRSRGIFLQLV